MNPRISLAFITAAAASLAVGWPLSLFAQDFPSRAITLVVPYGPGGVPDILARGVAAKMKDVLGVPVIIENKAGAATMIGTTEVARAKPDGYTLLINGSALALNPSLFKTVTYNAERDLRPVTRLANTPTLMYVAPALGVATFPEFLAKYKKDSSLNFGSPGRGTLPHISGEVFKARFGIEMQHVPYLSGPAVFNDLIPGRLQVTFNGAQFRGFVESGKAQALAVTSTRRLNLLPEVPTFAELGYPMPELDAGAWYGLFAPAGTPETVIERLNRAALMALADTDIRRQLVNEGFVPVGSSAHEAAVFLAQEIRRWPPILARAGIIAE